MRIVGRRGERRELDQLITSAAGGHGGAVVVAGEAGIGKSTVIGAVTENLTGFTVLRAAGTEFEQDLLYATLHQLCDPILPYRTTLPEVQQRVLEAVFGLGTQTSPDPLMVGLSVRGLLRAAAAEQPVCCVIDDAQWIDDASRRALVFVALRVSADPVALLFAARDVRAVPGIADLPRLSLAGLDDEQARSLIGTATRAGLDGEVFERILAEARGNPLALLEFAHDVGPFGEPGGARQRTSVVKALAEQFVRRFGQLPPTARELVALAAAEPIGDIGLLCRAAELLDLGPADFTLAEQAGLVTMGPRLRFRHSLVRSAVYESVDAPTRRRVHGALAEVTDPAVDSDRRAWHRAHAVVDTDESVALELARSADRARLRGGFAAAAAFLERAAQLTPTRSAGPPACSPRRAGSCTPAHRRRPARCSPGPTASPSTTRAGRRCACCARGSTMRWCTARKRPRRWSTWSRPRRPSRPARPTWKRSPRSCSTRTIRSGWPTCGCASATCSPDGSWSASSTCC